MEANILSRPGLIVIEHDSNDRMPNDVGILMRTDMRKYGNTGVSLYERERRFEMNIAIYPGSFDPVTNGHLDIQAFFKDI